jgi:hypothetical protein
MSFSSVDILLTDQMRSDLAELANGIAPLQRWIEQKKYNPGEDPTFSGQPMPWRAPGATLTPATTGLIDFFEGLLRETSDDVQSKATWERIAANPLLRSPFEDVQRWRAERGLDEFPTFGIVTSQNVLLDIQNNQIARISFYRDTLPDLAYCLLLDRPGTPAGWESFAQQLFTDQVSAWPETVYTASAFLSQFAADLMYAMLGMRNFSPIADQPEYATALLTELGQARRRGRKNTPAQATDAVKRFVAQIHKDMHSGEDR